MAFNHEKLHVYNKALSFVASVDAWLSKIRRNPPAVDHLRRASTSVPLNIAEGNGSFSQKKRQYFLNVAHGSALECAACLDILHHFSLLDGHVSKAGKSSLSEICAMLYRLKDVDVSGWQICDETAPYDISQSGYLFPHEKLEVYQTSLRMIISIDTALIEHSNGIHVRQGLERSSTGIVLNIAEGNGRFTQKDRINFLKIAYSHTLKTAAMIDVWSQGDRIPADIHSLLSKMMM